MSAREQVETYKRWLLMGLLDQCEPEQRDRWAEWTRGMGGEELMAAIEVIEGAIAVRERRSGAGV